MPLDPLSVDRLYRKTDLSHLTFTTTSDLEEVGTLVGQDRALEAVRFGARVRGRGYNIFVVGPKASGKHAAVGTYLSERAATLPAPDDWVYVHDFSDNHRPLALRLPPGLGGLLQENMAKLVSDLKATVPSVFEGEDYRGKREALDRGFAERGEALFKEVAEQAKSHGLVLLRTQQGLVVAPLQEDGKPMPPEDFQALPESRRTALQHKIIEVERHLQDVLRHAPRLERERRDAVIALVQETARALVEDEMEEAREGLPDDPALMAWMADVEADLIDNIEAFARQEQTQEAADRSLVPGEDVDPLKRYDVNVLVENYSDRGAPVVTEDHPTLGRLLGRIEYRAQLGAMVTDFTLIRPGALHRANGGYLLINGRKLLTQPHAWDALKRALYGQTVTIESPFEAATTALAVSIQPAPIPLSVKVVLFGDQWLHLQLAALDPDFGDLFKVIADFDEVLDRDEAHAELFARLIATVQKREKLRPFDKPAVARVIEHSARLVSDATKVTTRIGLIADVMREADYVGRDARHTIIRAGDVEAALAANARRGDRMERRSREMILRETVLVSTEGAVVGQLNGLSVLTIGSVMFGKPTRITARVRMGAGEQGGGKLVDIEREVELGGPLHSKGVLILQGYLAATYCPDVPLSLQASLVFEQSYGGVDGDSASSTELYALISALAELPIRQGIAVTGSVNQMGEVQAIGGVNEKIEGFFEICRERGLTGDQGVMIPAANVDNLMLKHEVVEACAAGTFRIWAVSTIAEGIELLTGVAAGERGADGLFPQGSVNAAVEARLHEFAARHRAYRRPDADPA
jgi:predicted ATP-dependent protease